MKLEDFWNFKRILFLLFFVYKSISCITGGNLALGKDCLQSSAWDNEGTYNYDATLATDGDTQQDMSFCGHICCSHTQADLGSWWTVDLGDVYEISYVVIFGRMDCCTDRLSKFYIEAIRPFRPCYENGLGDWTTFDLGEVSECYYQDWGTSYLNAGCKPGTVGQFLRIQLTEQNSLALCEVEVYGHIYNAEPLYSDKEDKKVVNVGCVVAGSYYEGQLLVKYQSRSVVECLAMCTQRSDCYVANYKTTRKECDLMDKRTDDNLQSLVTDQAWKVYFNL